MNISDYYFDGTVGGDIEFRIMAKKIWFEHIKRRPAIDKQTKQVRTYTPEELRIFNTPLEDLLREERHKLNSSTQKETDS